MKKRYTRRMTFNERAFVAFNLICPPTVNQFIFDGEGTLDPERWRKAAEVASEANPGTRLILKGHLGWSRWVDSGISPPVREVDGSNWNGMGPESAPWFQEPLSYREGPTCEIVLIQGPIPRVMFRAHHGVCDGRGTLFWAEEVFRVLRGETVIGSNSNMTDVEMCRSFQNQLRTPFPTEHIAPTGRPKGNESGVTWRRRSIKRKIPNLLARCARLAAEEAWRYGEGVVRFGIPVDMRPRKPGLFSTANLSFALYIEVNKKTTPDEIVRDITRQISQGDEGRLSRGDERLEYMPLWLMQHKIKKIILNRHERGIYSLSGILSNLGRVDLNRFSGAGFTARAFWIIPPATEYYPFFLVMAGYEGGSELTLSMPKVLASEGRIEDILQRMARGLERAE
ncbi:MAG: hypothetical protein APR55_01955 [Methanolinea sp. SDB]|nr:MAG: hypothetical protein APR55_01955 [Methanolinea sp. SDB]